MIVGNEVLLRGELSSKALAAYVNRVREGTRDIHVPVTYADVWEFWLRHPQLADAVDYLTIHILPYWEDEPVAPKDALCACRRGLRQGEGPLPGPRRDDRRDRLAQRRASSAEAPPPAWSTRRATCANSCATPVRWICRTTSSRRSTSRGNASRKARSAATGASSMTQARPKFSMQGPVVEEPRWYLGWRPVAQAWRCSCWPGCGVATGMAATGWLALAVAGFASGTAHGLAVPADAGLPAATRGMGGFPADVRARVRYRDRAGALGRHAAGR